MPRFNQLQDTASITKNNQLILLLYGWLQVREMTAFLYKKPMSLIYIGLLICFAFPAFGAVEITYGYDDLNRLSSVVRTDGPKINYFYDEVGNITDYQVTNSTYTQSNAARLAAPMDEGEASASTLDASGH